MLFERIYVFVHDGLYCVRSGGGMANSRFLASLVRLGLGPRLVVCPVWTPKWNPDYEEQWYGRYQRLLAVAGATIMTVDNGSGGTDRYGDVSNWRVSSERALKLVRDSFEPDKRTVVISFDSPFLNLVPLLADVPKLCHVHVPHGTARLQAPNHHERLDYEHEAFSYVRSRNTLVGAISKHMAEHLVADYGVARHKLVSLHSGVLLDEHERCSQEQVDQILKTVGLPWGAGPRQSPLCGLLSWCDVRVLAFGEGGW